MNILLGTVLILDKSEKVLGAGFLASEHLVFTCAHLLPQGKNVKIKFLADGSVAEADIRLRTQDPGHDFAILRVHQPPASAEILSLGSLAWMASEYGFPIFADGQPIVIQTAGEVPSIDTQDIIRLESAQESAHILSGAPLIDLEQDAVIGMVSKPISEAMQAEQPSGLRIVYAAALSPRIMNGAITPDDFENDSDEILEGDFLFAKAARRAESYFDAADSETEYSDSLEDDSYNWLEESSSKKPKMETTAPEESPEWLSDDEEPGWTNAEPPVPGDMDEWADLELEELAPEESARSSRPVSPPSKRVLNANFASAENGQILARSQPLQPGSPYDLLVDVGLPWQKEVSLLGEQAFFPEDADTPYLRREDREQGWFDLEVVFVSQEFQPNLVSGQIRVPVNPSGRSIPYINNALASQPGPLKLRLNAPLTGERARGRLSLYYGAQVLQSAVLNMGISNQTASVEENSGKVDYVLTSDYRQLGDISTRHRTGSGQDERIRVGILMNDDRSGSHRILLKGDAETGQGDSLPPAWKAYDAQAIQNMLEEARRILSDPSGQPLDFDQDTFLLDKFREDLFALAKLGANLYSILLQGLTPAEGLAPLAWRRQFRTTLRAGDIIQLARAGSVPATHIIPWALVYDHLLEPDRSDLPLKLCPVVEEQWDANFLRRKPAYRNQENLACPHEAEHGPNTVCPFGFWGYKYTLEQPISALLGKGWDVEPARSVRAGDRVKVAVAATTDVPRQSRREQHFQSIHDSLNAEYIPNIPASERDQVRDSLRAPQLVYILCHGGKDDKLTYLSIGPRGKDARYTITPDLPGAWGERDFIDLEQWQETRPLVFINGCYTTDLLPDLTLNFVSAFRDLLAGGVIGTEIPVTVEHGYLAAEKFFERLGRGQDVGQAILGMRWDLLNEGSFLGLAYTPYAMADLHLERR